MGLETVRAIMCRGSACCLCKSAHSEHADGHTPRTHAEESESIDLFEAIYNNDLQLLQASKTPTLQDEDAWEHGA